MKTIAANIVGGGLAAATGVGFVAIPKRVDNHIDEYSERLENEQAELARLRKEQAGLAQKLLEADASLQPAPAVAPPATSPAAPAQQ